MDYEEARVHVGDMMTQEVDETALRAIPHYMWTQGDRWHRRGFCTNCMQWMDLKKIQSVPDFVVNDPYVESYDFSGAEEFTAPGWIYEQKTTESGKHKSWGYCPRCGAMVQFRSLAYSRKNVRDRVFLIRYQKSVLVPGTLVMIGYDITADWGGDGRVRFALPANQCIACGNMPFPVWQGRVAVHTGCVYYG